MPKASIIGARGYLGRELLRLLLHHPHIDEVVPTSTSSVGQTVAEALPALRGHTDAVFRAPDDPEALDADVVFLATPGGEAAHWTQAYEEAGVNLAVDLSRDHRLQALNGGDWVYGLADVMPVPKGARRVANPGCYPTASLLALAPALRAGLVAPGTIIVDGKSGVSGAGVTPRNDLHFPEMNETVRAYKVLGHDHTAEIQAAANHLDGGAHKVRFTPHLVPQTRGLLATVYAPLSDGASSDDVHQAYEKAYAGSAFVRFGPEPSTANVRLSNMCDVAVDVDPETGLMVARGGIDNLVKGGSGTAVQNMNTALGWAPEAGLRGTGGGL